MGGMLLWKAHFVLFFYFSEANNFTEQILLRKMSRGREKEWEYVFKREHELEKQAKRQRQASKYTHIQERTQALESKPEEDPSWTMPNKTKEGKRRKKGGGEFIMIRP